MSSNSVADDESVTHTRMYPIRKLWLCKTNLPVNTTTITLYNILPNAAQRLILFGECTHKETQPIDRETPLLFEAATKLFATQDTCVLSPPAYHINGVLVFSGDYLLDERGYRPAHPR